MNDLEFPRIFHTAIEIILDVTKFHPQIISLLDLLFKCYRLFLYLVLNLSTVSAYTKIKNILF